MAGALHTPFVAHSDEFSGILGGEPRLVKVRDTDAHEGPVYVRDEDALYFTSLPVRTNKSEHGTWRVTIRRLALNGDRFPVDESSVSTVRARANMANGMTLDREGRLVICEQGTLAEPGRISRFNLSTGKTDTVVDQWSGLPLNSPNDVVVKSDGTVWFTDPSYGYLQGFKDKPLIGDNVYRYDPENGDLSVVADSLNKPNGLAFSPDESVLYIGDSGAIQEPDTYYAHLPHHVLAFDVVGGRRLANGRLFAMIVPGFPDGIKVDSQARVYVSASSGVQIFNPTGERIGEIRVPGAVNFTFGGPGNNILYITADTTVWAAVLQATGARRPHVSHTTPRQHSVR